MRRRSIKGLRFDAIQQLAKEQAFELRRKHLNRYSDYVLEWRDQDFGKHSRIVRNLANIQPIIRRLQKCRQAGMPGEWYLYWWIDSDAQEREPDDLREKQCWLPFDRWIHLIVEEGVIGKNPNAIETERLIPLSKQRWHRCLCSLWN